RRTHRKAERRTHLTIDDLVERLLLEALQSQANQRKAQVAVDGRMSLRGCWPEALGPAAVYRFMNRSPLLEGLTTEQGSKQSAVRFQPRAMREQEQHAGRARH